MPQHRHRFLALIRAGQHLRNRSRQPTLVVFPIPENRKILQFNRQVVPIILRGAWDSEAAEAILHVEVILLEVVAVTEAATMVHVHTAVEWAGVVVAAMAEAVQEATEVLQVITVAITMALLRRTVKWVEDTNTAVTTQDLHHGSSLTHGNHQTQPQ